jgi:hypothetical protein
MKELKVGGLRVAEKSGTKALTETGELELEVTGI